MCLTITPNINCNPILGCTDPNANNYNANANIDDGSCTYPEPVYGCTDPLADNYNATATVDDGSCTYPEEGELIYGCTDPNSDFYDPLATIDDGSCCDIIYEEENYILVGTPIAGSGMGELDLNDWSGGMSPITPTYNLDTTTPRAWQLIPWLAYPCRAKRVLGWRLALRLNDQAQYPTRQWNALHNYITNNGTFGTSMGYGPILHTWADIIAALNSLGIYSSTLVGTDAYDATQAIHVANGFYQDVCVSVQEEVTPGGPPGMWP